MNELRGLWRGKSEIGGQWIIGYLRKAVYSCDDVRFQITDTWGAHFIVDPSTLGECTGLRDKNCKLIFEGDVFRFDDEVWSSCYTSCGTEYDSWEVKNCGVVGFDEEYARFDFVQYQFNENSVEADLHENRDIEFAEFVSNLEIAGNIHDAPELLKGG